MVVVSIVLCVPTLYCFGDQYYQDTKYWRIQNFRVVMKLEVWGNLPMGTPLNITPHFLLCHNEIKRTLPYEVLTMLYYIKKSLSFKFTFMCIE